MGPSCAPAPLMLPGSPGPPTAALPAAQESERRGPGAAVALPVGADGGEACAHAGAACVDWGDAAEAGRASAWPWPGPPWTPPPPWSCCRRTSRTRGAPAPPPPPHAHRPALVTLSPGQCCILFFDRADPLSRRAMEACFLFGCCRSVKECRSRQVCLCTGLRVGDGTDFCASQRNACMCRGYREAEQGRRSRLGATGDG